MRKEETKRVDFALQLPQHCSYFRKQREEKSWADPNFLVPPPFPFLRANHSRTARSVFFLVDEKALNQVELRSAPTASEVPAANWSALQLCCQICSPRIPWQKLYLLWKKRHNVRNRTASRDREQTEPLHVHIVPNTLFHGLPWSYATFRCGGAHKRATFFHDCFSCRMWHVRGLEGGLGHREGAVAWNTGFSLRLREVGITKSPFLLWFFG